MAIPKLKGIETEWSVSVRSKEGNLAPAGFSHLDFMIEAIMKYLKMPDFFLWNSWKEVENSDRVLDDPTLGPILRDRGRSLLSAPTPVYHGLLPNGSRFYVDGPHLEYSTAECLSAKTLVAADRAGEAIIGLAMLSINQRLADKGERVIIYKDNTDRKGHFYGCHENYLVARDAFSRIINPRCPELGWLASFFISRLPFTGAGKLGDETLAKREDMLCGVYQISQRADSIVELLSDCTIIRRALVNMRDEPLADKRRFARLHVIVGDANLAEVANYMKVGITSIILKMIEDRFLGGDIILKDPVNGIKLASRDLTCLKPVLETSGGRKLSSIDLSEAFFEKAMAYSKVVEFSAEEKDIMQKWQETNSDFRTGNEERLRRRFDWVLKWHILRRYLEANKIAAPLEELENVFIRDDEGVSRNVINQLARKDFLYHHMDKERGLYWLYREDGDIEEIVSKEEVANLVKNPPEDCRSYFRGRCIGKFGTDVDYADWDVLRFREKGGNGFHKNFHIFYYSPTIELGNPLWGSKVDVGQTIDSARDYRDLFAALKKEAQ